MKQFYYKLFSVFFLYFFTSFSNVSAQIFPTKIDTNIIKSLEERTKSIHYRDPENGILMLDSLCAYYKLQGKTKDFYTARVTKAHCYGALQRDYLAMGLYEDASKYFLKINDSVRLFHIYSGIGNIYMNLKDEKKASDFFALSISYCNEVLRPEHKFLAYTNYAASLFKLEQYDTIRLYYNRAKELIGRLKTNIDDRKNRIQVNFAYLDLREKKFQAAIDKASSATSFFKQKQYLQDLMLSYEIIGLGYFGLKNFSQAKIYIDSIAFFNKQFNSTSNYYDIYQDYFKIDSAQGNYLKAIQHLLKMLGLKDSLYEQNKLNLTKDLLIKYETDKKELENIALETENEIKQKTISMQRWMILLIIFLAIGLGVVLYFYLRFRNEQQKKLAEQEKITSELKALKAQLNPHFIQNIFQIIANQVALNPQDVSVFLQKTSNYFRSVLNGTDKNTQSLEDEISFTENYLQFQQSLFPNKLSYEIKINDEVDSFGIMVPTMLLQPFVENSIKYGLQATQEPMHINLHFSMANNYLKITIIDDGNNAATSVALNDKSFGNALISKRLNLFYKNNAKQPKLLSNIAENEKGFIVELLLPI